MLLSEYIRRCTADLAAIYPLPEARSIVSLLVCERLSVPSWKLVTDAEMEIPSRVSDVLESDRLALMEGKPLQYVLGYADFFGHRFNVSPSVLIPRPETELLVEKAISMMPSPTGRILDLCTGSGCIAWSLAYAFPEAEVVAVDLSADALGVAESQFSGETFRPAVKFVQADILDLPFAENLGRFDMVVSNPPYIADSERMQMRRNVLDFEPSLALFVPDSDPLLFYRAVAEWSEKVLNPGGRGIVEINERFGPETAGCFEKFESVEIVKDLALRDRFVSFGRKITSDP